MQLDMALKLRVGDSVCCPADRGDKPFTGKVSAVGESISYTPRGSFIWVEVSIGSRKSVWPSNRLSRI